MLLDFQMAFYQEVGMWPESHIRIILPMVITPNINKHAGRLFERTQ